MKSSTKKLSIGIKSFSRMIEGNFIYVDKTKYIQEIIESGDCFFLSRPRRFGKSLLLSTLKEIFLGNKDLFKSLHIGNSSFAWEKHPVIHLSFSAMNANSASQLEQDIEYNLIKIARRNGINIDEAPSIQTKFETLIEELASQNRVVILVDEYDFPLINNIHNVEIAEECRKVLHDFFAVLKDAGDYIRFIFITGVTKFSKTSIFSGLNNLDDLSLMPQAARVLGYNHAELSHYFQDYIEKIAFHQNSTPDIILENMRQWYNGYQFTDAQTQKESALLKVYNPFSVLRYLAHGKLLNYWADTGTPQFLAHLIETQNYPLSEIDGAEVNYEETKSYDIDKIRLLPLLWQTGYLTIDSYDSTTQNYKLTYPNQEVKVSFFNYFLQRLTQVRIAEITNYISDFMNALKAHDLAAFFKTFETFLANIAYTIQVKDEKYYQTLFYAILKLIGADVEAENVTNDGRIDAVLETPSHIYICEFKLDMSAEVALRQIEEKHYYKKYRNHKKRIILVGVGFSHEKRNITGWICKDLPNL